MCTEHEPYAKAHNNKPLKFGWMGEYNVLQRERCSAETPKTFIEQEMPLSSFAEPGSQESLNPKE
jgi:hypothetical protein